VDIVSGPFFSSECNEIYWTLSKIVAVGCLSLGLCTGYLQKCYLTFETLTSLDKWLGKRSLCYSILEAITSSSSSSSLQPFNCDFFFAIDAQVLCSACLHTSFSTIIPTSFFGLLGVIIIQE
jgi:hypothetical protein